jgi:hypothetical protein
MKTKRNRKARKSKRYGGNLPKFVGVDDDCINIMINLENYLEDHTDTRVEHFRDMIEKKLVHEVEKSRTSRDGRVMFDCDEKELALLNHLKEDNVDLTPFISYIHSYQN